MVSVDVPKTTFGKLLLAFRITGRHEYGVGMRVVVGSTSEGYS
jgi:hypothetical protein